MWRCPAADELDKLSDTPRGDEIANVLIHLTDPAQNACMHDRYFHGLHLDFSKCIMVFSYNNARRVPPVLLDRLKRITLEEPTPVEKIDIVKSHLVPRLTRNVATSAGVTLTDDGIDEILRAHRDDVGMRGIERSLAQVFHIALACEQYGSKRIAGLKDEPMGPIDAAFAKHVLATSSGNCRPAGANTPPPSLMYA